MAKNDFKSFATAAGANVMNQADWEALPALLTGFQSGKASSAQVNKAIRQSATSAAMLGQFIANSGVDALDNGDIGALVTKFTNALTKNLGLKTAALRDVGVGANQIPDMNAFASVLGTNGWFAMPAGYIVQFGVGSFGNPSATAYSQVYSLPRSYPSEHIATIAIGNTTASSSSAVNIIMAIIQKTLTGFTLRADTNTSATMSQNQSFNFISIGR